MNSGNVRFVLLYVHGSILIHTNQTICIMTMFINRAVYVVLYVYGSILIHTNQENHYDNVYKISNHNHYIRVH
jgi:hypothetical protein